MGMRGGMLGQREMARASPPKHPPPSLKVTGGGAGAAAEPVGDPAASSPPGTYGTAAARCLHAPRLRRGCASHRGLDSSQPSPPPGQSPGAGSAPAAAGGGVRRPPSVPARPWRRRWRLCSGGWRQGRERRKEGAGAERVCTGGGPVAAGVSAAAGPRQPSPPRTGTGGAARAGRAGRSRRRWGGLRGWMEARGGGTGAVEGQDVCPPASPQLRGWPPEPGREAGGGWRQAALPCRNLPASPRTRGQSPALGRARGKTFPFLRPPYSSQIGKTHRKTAQSLQPPLPAGRCPPPQPQEELEGCKRLRLDSSPPLNTFQPFANGTGRDWPAAHPWCPPDGRGQPQGPHRSWGVGEGGDREQSPRRQQHPPAVARASIKASADPAALV